MRLRDFLTKVDTGATESNSEGAGKGGLRITCIGTQVVTVVAAHHVECTSSIQPHKISRHHNEKRSQPGRNVVQ